MSGLILIRAIHASVVSLAPRGFVPSGADELREPHCWAVAFDPPLLEWALLQLLPLLHWPDPIQPHSS